jgi:hypothetical protein
MRGCRLSDLRSEPSVGSILRVFSLPLSLSGGVILGVFIGALFGRPGIGVAIGAAVGVGVGVGLSAAFLIGFFFKERG